MTRISVPATIESVQLGKQGEFRASVEDAAWVEARLGLAFDLGTGPHRTEVKTKVPVLLWARLGVGGSVTVLVDPDDADELEIDWDGELVEPTLEQRAERDPILRSLLDRRVDQ